MPATARASASVINPHHGSVGERIVFVTNVYHGSVEMRIPEPAVTKDVDGGNERVCE